MTEKTSSQIREEFLEFFREKGHEIVVSDSLVPHNDPTLLFTNAGMNQFKDVFLGTGTRPFKRAVDTQKCLRVSGKHNDLEEVGVDTYHHTFFEMLGNWSFGDYFKREAISWAWELLVDRWKLDPSRLYATVHEGDEQFKLGPDREAAEFWKSETSIDHDHILFCPSKDNFWMMGETGPCGPCSEIHVDLRSEEDRQLLDGSLLVNKDDPRVMEIWNLVFIQYNAPGDGTLEKLADSHVDTGMGFERMVAVLQGKTSNYDTDLFQGLITEIRNLAPKDSKASSAKKEIALRVIADHIRTIGFAIADGASPGNTGRGYVIRRILRRAVRFGYQTLGFREPFLYKLIPSLIDLMGDQFPELSDRRDLITRVTRGEEESFLETLGTGVDIFEGVVPKIQTAEGSSASVFAEEIAGDSRFRDLLQKAYVDSSGVPETVERFYQDASEKNLPGEIAFLLHDTYGFPIDLTQLMARESGLSVRMSGYNRLMQQQKNRARAASSFVVAEDDGGSWTRVGSASGSSIFVGYDETETSGVHIVAYRQSKKEMVFEVVLDKTPFYGESGGQIGDTGKIRFGADTVSVLDTKKIEGETVHFVDALPSDVSVGGVAMVDSERRSRIEKNHTATHLVHAALREELGEHVVQKGSLVAPDRLRFDFSHFEKVPKASLQKIESRVNEIIQRDIKRHEERGVGYDDAIAAGAMALFGEKYGDKVRMITFDPEYSVELCGGTHVSSTGVIGIFKFLSEGSIASGVRRIEAVTGMDALEWVNERIGELDRVEEAFKSSQDSADVEVRRLLESKKALEKELQALKLSQLSTSIRSSVDASDTVDGVRVATLRCDDLPMDLLRSAAMQAKTGLAEESVLVLGSADSANQKVYLAAAVTDDLTARLPAGKLVGVLAKMVGGGGGGKPDLATAGGKEIGKLESTLAEVSSVVADLLSD